MDLCRRRCVLNRTRPPHHVQHVDLDIQAVKEQGTRAKTSAPFSAWITKVTRSALMRRSDHWLSGNYFRPAATHFASRFAD
jgi:hypothetical protein